MRAQDEAAFQELQESARLEKLEKDAKKKKRASLADSFLDTENQTDQDLEPPKKKKRASLPVNKEQKARKTPVSKKKADVKVETNAAEQQQQLLGNCF